MLPACARLSGVDLVLRICDPTNENFESKDGWLVSSLEDLSVLGYCTLPLSNLWSKDDAEEVGAGLGRWLGTPWGWLRRLAEVFRRLFEWAGARVSEVMAWRARWNGGGSAEWRARWNDGRAAEWFFPPPTAFLPSTGATSSLQQPLMGEDPSHDPDSSVSTSDFPHRCAVSAAALPLLRVEGNRGKRSLTAALQRVLTVLRNGCLRRDFFWKKKTLKVLPAEVLLSKKKILESAMGTSAWTLGSGVPEFPSKLHAFDATKVSWTGWKTETVWHEAVENGAVVVEEGAKSEAGRDNNKADGTTASFFPIDWTKEETNNAAANGTGEVSRSSHDGRGAWDGGGRIGEAPAVAFPDILGGQDSRKKLKKRLVPNPAWYRLETAALEEEGDLAPPTSRLMCLGRVSVDLSLSLKATPAVLVATGKRAFLATPAVLVATGKRAFLSRGGTVEAGRRETNVAPSKTSVATVALSPSKTSSIRGGSMEPIPPAFFSKTSSRAQESDVVLRGAGSSEANPLANGVVHNDHAARQQSHRFHEAGRSAGILQFQSRKIVAPRILPPILPVSQQEDHYETHGAGAEDGGAGVTLVQQHVSPTGRFLGAWLERSSSWVRRNVLWFRSLFGWSTGEDAGWTPAPPHIRAPVSAEFKAAIDQTTLRMIRPDEDLANSVGMSRYFSGCVRKGWVGRCGWEGVVGGYRG